MTLIDGFSDLIVQPDTRNQTGTTHRYQDGFQVRHLIKNLQRHCTLTGDDIPIVIPIDIGKSLFPSQLISLSARLRAKPAFPATTTLASNLWQVVILIRSAQQHTWHHHGHRDPQQFAVIEQGQSNA